MNSSLSPFGRLGLVIALLFGHLLVVGGALYWKGAAIREPETEAASFEDFSVYVLAGPGLRSGAGWDLNDASHLYLPTERNFTRLSLQRQVREPRGELYGPFQVELSADIGPPDAGVEVDSRIVVPERSLRQAVSSIRPWIDAEPLPGDARSEPGILLSVSDVQGRAVWSRRIESVPERLRRELWRPVRFDVWIEQGVITGAPLRRGTSGDAEIDAYLDQRVGDILQNTVLNVSGFASVRVLP